MNELLILSDFDLHKTLFIIHQFCFKSFLYKSNFLFHTSNVLATLINKGWPDKYYVIPKEPQPYYSFRDELSMSNDIIMRGHRFMIPKSLQTYYVEQLHKGHPGIKATKQRASEHV